MRISIVLRALLPVAIIISPSTTRAQTACSQCDCSHFPIKDTNCVECCFYQKGKVTAVSSTIVTVTRRSPVKKERSRTFQIQRNRTKINGKLREGVDATVYYHRIGDNNIATRIDGPGFYRGFLVPANLPGPPETCKSVPMPSGAVKLFLGNSEVYSTQQTLVVLQIE